jgi:hypothetical protein
MLRRRGESLSRVEVGNRILLYSDRLEALKNSIPLWIRADNVHPYLEETQYIQENSYR